MKLFSPLAAPIMPIWWTRADGIKVPLSFGCTMRVVFDGIIYPACRPEYDPQPPLPKWLTTGDPNGTYDLQLRCGTVPFPFTGAIGDYAGSSTSINASYVEAVTASVSWMQEYSNSGCSTATSKSSSGHIRLANSYSTTTYTRTLDLAFGVFGWHAMFEAVLGCNDLYDGVVVSNLHTVEYEVNANSVAFGFPPVYSPSVQGYNGTATLTLL
jgi:hypothetical protein